MQGLELKKSRVKITQFIIRKRHNSVKLKLKLNKALNENSSLQGLPQRICDDKKIVKIRRDFWQLSTLIANISGTDQHMENRKSSWTSTIPPALDKKSWCALVHKRKSYCTLINLHHKKTFFGTVNFGLWGAAPSNFYTRWRLTKPC